MGLLEFYEGKGGPFGDNLWTKKENVTIFDTQVSSSFKDKVLKVTLIWKNDGKKEIDEGKL